MKTLFSCLSLSFAFVGAGFSQGVIDIATEFEKQKIAAVEKYLEDNPDAEDKDKALSILIGGSMTVGNFDPIPGLLQQRYDLFPKEGENVDLQRLLQEIVQPYIESSIMTDKKDQAKKFVNQFKSDFAAHPQAQQLHQVVDQLAANLSLPGVGDIMDLNFTAMDGTKVNLAEMTDKVVLVDFWATWCGPCIAEMPNVIKTYDAHKEKGFEVIGISLDQDKAALEKYVADNKMAWPQYYDGKGWENEIAQQYSIGQIPATFLIGKEGKIIATNLRGEALEKAVEEALAE